MSPVAGWSRLKIPCDPSWSLLGYSFRNESLPPGNLGELDPLYARALVVAQGEQRFCLITLDLCILEPSLCLRLRRDLSAALSLPVEAVMIACSHTHSGPFPPQAPPESSPGSEVDRIVRNSHENGPSYDLLRDTVLAVAQCAAGLLCPVELFWQSAPLGAAYQRRVLGPQGVEFCWNPQERPDLLPALSPDPTCTVLVLRQVRGTRQAVVWNFGAHPVCLGKTSRVLSADWPGEVNAALAREGSEGFFLLGACGETHPWVATQSEPEAMRKVGRTVFAFLDLLLQAPRPLAGEFALRRSDLQVGNTDLELLAWELGGIKLLACPVELFASLGAEVRRKVNAPVMLASNTNGWTGYWPDQDAFAAGGYEIDAARAMGRTAGDGEALAKVLIDLANLN